MKDTEARLRNSQSKSFKKLNPHLFNLGGEDDEEHALIEALTKPKPTPAKKRIRQSAKPLLNKLEGEFLSFLKAGYSENLYLITAQAVRWKLANGLWYKSDFVVFPKTGVGRPTAYEVKGPHAFRGGYEALKMVAHQYPAVTFILAWTVAGIWHQQEVLP